MKRNFLGQTMMTVCLCLFGLQASAQGIVVTKTDGTKVYFKAEEVVSVGVYGYGEGPKQEIPEGKVYSVNGVEFTMMPVEGGTFKMGNEYGEDDEMPVHEVKLNSFSIGQTEVTQELWEAVMGNNPSNWKGPKLPVEKVTKDDCLAFIAKLNQLTGLQFRLPTEAEWEYAARGGNQGDEFIDYSGSNDLWEVAWFSSNSDRKTHEVAMMAPNRLGIYDMSGNVWEWCQDWYDSSYYASSPVDNPTGPTSGSICVKRGGGWNNGTPSCRVSNRHDNPVTSSYDDSGFRLAL